MVLKHGHFMSNSLFFVFKIKAIDKFYIQNNGRKVFRKERLQIRV